MKLYFILSNKYLYIVFPAPLVQRVSKNMMVVKCSSEEAGHPLGFLHFSFQCSKEGKFFCSCKAFKANQREVAVAQGQKRPPGGNGPGKNSKSLVRKKNLKLEINFFFNRIRFKTLRIFSDKKNWMHLESGSAFRSLGQGP